jgi:4-amino-4-deoxy-L-arabinose transferase-like glycosyltransferase
LPTRTDNYDLTCGAAGSKVDRGKSNYLPLMFVIAIAAFLRFQYVDQPYVDAFGWREASTAMMADNFYRRSWNIFYPEVGWSGPGPGYQGREFQTITYLAAVLYGVLGQHDWVGRSVAIAFGLWGIFALYQLIRHVWDEERALVGAAVMAVLPGSVFIERSFLPDPAQVALLTTSLWMLVVYCRTEQVRCLILASCFGALGSLTKLPGAILVVPALYIVVALRGDRLRQGKRQLLQLGSAAALTCLPVVGYYLWARHLSLTYPPYHFAGEGKFLWDSGVRAWLQNGYFLPALFRQLVGWMWTWPFLIMAVVGLMVPPSWVTPSDSDALTERGSSSSASWLFHWWIVAMILRYLVEAMHLVTDPYNQHLTNPAAAALAGHGLVWTTRSISKVLRRDAVRPMVAGALLICTITGQDKDRYRPHYRDQLVLGMKTRALSHPDDLVVVLGLNPIAIYYSGRRGWVFPPAEVWRSKVNWDYSTHDLEMLEVLRNRGARWLIIPVTNEYTNGSGRKYLRSYFSNLLVYIESHYELVEADALDGLIYHVKSQDGQSAHLD